MRIGKFLLLALVFAPSLWAATTDRLRLEPLPEVVALAAVQPLPPSSQLELALILSGLPPANTGSWHQEFARWQAELAAKLPPGLSEEKTGEFVLEFLHQNHLRRYQTYQTRLDTLIENGQFNCVSSAVAYLLLGRSVGLDVQAVATTSHAFCLVRLSDGREIDVETTTPYGFNPGTKTEFTNSFGATGFAYVPPGKYSARKTITDRGLLGLIVQNRMAAWQSSGNLVDCVGAALDRWALDPSPESKETLIEGYINLAADNNARKDYLAGLSLAESLLSYLGPVAEVKNLVNALLNNHINTLLDKNDFSGAFALATQWKNRECLSQDQWNQVSGVILAARLVTDVKNLPYLEAARNVETAFTQGSIGAPRRQELLSAIYGQEIQRRATSGNLAAWQFIDSLPTDVRSQPTVTKAREIYVYNWSVDVHNQFASLWNRGQKDAARQLLSESLKLQPENALLKKDQILSQGKS
ncbi:MAG: hypothetical protein WCG80_12525 [Spirochaetales bacterium]